MKEIFEIFTDKLHTDNVGNLSKKEYLYALISLPFKESDRNNYESLISKIFKLAYDTNGDINQFFCGNTLILYGLPLPDKNRYTNIKKLIDGLNKLNREKIKGIIGEDNGYCGVFGFEKRKEVTVISEVLVEEVNNLIKMSEYKILIRESLKNKI
jgi:hypothetical protein